MVFRGAQLSGRIRWQMLGSLLPLHRVDDWRTDRRLRPPEIPGFFPPLERRYNSSATSSSITPNLAAALAIKMYSSRNKNFRPLFCNWSLGFGLVMHEFYS